jgi:hypothetical protein
MEGGPESHGSSRPPSLSKPLRTEIWLQWVGIDNLSTRNDKKLGKVWVIQLFSLILHCLLHPEILYF